MGFNNDKVIVYGTMIEIGNYIQVVGRCDIVRNGNTYILESYNPPYVEKKNGEWYVDGKLYEFK